MPQVRPFHFSLPVTSENFQTRFIAIKYSITEEKWIAQVGIERAFSGSMWLTQGKEKTADSERPPAPKRKGEWTSKPSDGPKAIAAINAPNVPKAAVRKLPISGGFGLVDASLKPKTCERSRIKIP